MPDFMQQIMNNPNYIQGIAGLAGENPQTEMLKHAQMQSEQAKTSEIKRQRQVQDALPQAMRAIKDMPAQQAYDFLLQIGLEPAKAATMVKSIQEFKQKTVPSTAGLQEGRMWKDGVSVPIPGAMGASVPTPTEQRGITRDIAKEERQAARTTAEKKQAAKISGYEFQEGIIPTSTDATKVKEATIVAKGIKLNIKKMKKMLKEHGTEDFTMFGTAAQEMEGFRAEILTQYNRLAELGALAGGDLALLESIVADPNAFWTLGSSTLKRYETLDKMVDDGLATKLEASGYKKAGGKPKGEVIDYKEYFN